MGKLDSLKINEAPLAFASFATKHNQLVDIIAGMVGQNGVSVTISEKNAIIRGNIANGGGGTTLSNTANVVGSDGRLQNVYAASAISNAYPTELRVANGSVTMYQNGSGFKYTDGSGYYVTVDTTSGVLVHSGEAYYTRIKKDSVELAFGDGSGISMVRNEGIHVSSLSGFDCNISPAQVTKNMNIREIDVCENGVAKKMLVIGSAPYT